MIFLGLVLALIVIFFAVTGIIYYIAFFSPHESQKKSGLSMPDNEQYRPHKQRTKMLIEQFDKEPYEEVYIKSFDGLKLFGRYYHRIDGAPLDIGFHGYRSTAARDSCGMIKISKEAGHNSLIVDQRAHGKSEGRCLTFGIKERYDCKKWVDYAITRFGKDTEIHLCGVSMGGATVLMASGLPLPNNVKGIIADCPYSSPMDIIGKVTEEMGVSKKLAAPFIKAAARIYGGFNITETTVEKEVRRSKIPVLIIHGDDDRFVPHGMSEVVAKGNPHVERHTFKGAGHGLSYMLYTEQYHNTIHKFFQKTKERS